MASKGPRILLRMVSQGINPKTGKRTGHFYTTEKNPKNIEAGGATKLKLTKYDPVIRKHVEYKEEKIK